MYKGKWLVIIIMVCWGIIPTNAIDDSGLVRSQLEAALKAARSSNDYQDLANAYFELGIYEEESRSNIDKAFVNLSRSLDYYKLVSDSLGIKKCEYHIARQLLSNDMIDEALQRLLSLEKSYEPEVYPERLAEVKLLLFDIYLDELNVEKAAETLSDVETLLKEKSSPDLDLEWVSRKIVYLDLLKQYDEALAMANLCFDYSQGNRQGRAKCLLYRARIYLEKEQVDSALIDLKVAISGMGSVPYSKQRLQAYNLLSKSYRKNGQLDNAYIYSEQYAALQDSILNKNRVQTINNLTYKFEAKEKATELKLLEKEKDFVQKSNAQQRRALIVLGLALGGLLIGVYYIIRFYSDRIKAVKIIEKQKERINKQRINELKDRIQINSMQSMISGQEVERERIAKDLHDSLGGLLSTIKLQMDNIKKESDQSSAAPEIDKATRLLDVAVSEVRTISQDLQPGALKRLGVIPAINDLVNRYRSGNGPEVTFHHYGIPKNLDQNFAMGIYRIVQEILNNAIKHAEASEIFVQLNREGEEIVIHIEDDGIGFDPDQEFKSMGLSNIKSRVNYLQGTIDIDSRIGEGTSFIIHLNGNFDKAESAA